MIRRPISLTDGTPQLVLIPQPEHARLSGDLAKVWGAGPFAPLVPRDEVLAAIYHHDDGWIDWEQSPEVDPKTGRPLDFTEMPVAEGLRIWRGSIVAAARIGPLASWLVSGHFSALLRRFSNNWRQSSPAEIAMVEGFLDEQDARREQWLRDWQAGDLEQNTTAIADRALSHLQLFDALSLWLCCAERTEPQQFEPPSSPRLTLAPSGPAEMLISPWPLRVEQHSLQVTGRTIPVGHYTRREDLEAAPSEPVTLQWTLRPQTLAGASFD